MTVTDFAGISICVKEGWFDITGDLPEGTPPTLARSAESGGVGALQFSTARYQSGATPHIDIAVLKDLLTDFARRQGWLPPMAMNVHTSGVQRVSADIVSAGDFIRVWYVSDGTNVALVTYVAEAENPRIEPELRDAEQMLESIRFDGQ